MPRVQKVTPKALRNPLSEPFGECRVSRKPARKPPFRNLLSNPPLSDLASESDTCPEYPYIGPSRKLPSAPRVQRVILPPEASECDTCPEYPSRENPSGCRPSSPPVPECLDRKPHPGALRASHVSRGPSRREFPREITRVRRVSRDLIQENPGCTRMRHVCRAGKPPGCRSAAQRRHPRETPGHSANTPCVPGSVSFSVEF